MIVICLTNIFNTRITPKGPQGLNLSNAYDQAKRSYDVTMMGILAASTSPKSIGTIV